MYVVYGKKHTHCYLFCCKSKMKMENGKQCKCHIFFWFAAGQI